MNLPPDRYETANTIISEQIDKYATWLMDDNEYRGIMAMDQARVCAFETKQRLNVLFAGVGMLTPVETILLDGVFLHVYEECKSLYQENYKGQ